MHVMQCVQSTEAVLGVSSSRRMCLHVIKWNAALVFSVKMKQIASEFEL